MFFFYENVLTGRPQELQGAVRSGLFLTEQARANDPFAQIGTRTVSVQVTSVVRASESSFQVKWTEQVYERGSLAATSRWTALPSA